MKFIVSLLGWLISGLLISIMVVAVAENPLPFIAHIQFIVLFWIPWCAERENTSAWAGLLVCLICTDFFSAAPFGVYTFAFLLAFYAAYVLQHKVFTSVTAIVRTATTALCLAVFRLSIWAFLGILHILRRHETSISWSHVRDAGYDIMVTSCIALCFYFLRHYKTKNHYSLRSQ